MKKSLFQHVKANTCPNCGKDTLWHVDYERNLSRLNENGYPIESFTDGYQDKLQCSSCGKEFKAIKRGMTYCVDLGLPPIRKIMREFNPFQT